MPRERRQGRWAIYSLLATTALFMAEPGDSPNRLLAQQLTEPKSAPLAASRSALVPLGTTYSRAQAATWLDTKHFIVGRWDGTLTHFRTMTRAEEFGPVLLDALTTPAKRGVEMVARLGPRQFVSSNDPSSLALWQRHADRYVPLTLPFDPRFGMAVSALVVDHAESRLLVVGHQEGFLSIWTMDPNGTAADDAFGTTPRFLRVASVRSPKPIDWHWQTWHVRGLAAVKPGQIISVAEDGDLCLIEIPSGKIISRRRYHAAAKRGLNDVAVLGDLVAVVNCAVGSHDRNLWIYRISGNRLEQVAQQRLISDQDREQVFTFSVKLFEYERQPHFVASTEEGLIWLGKVKDHKIVILNQTRVASEGGVVLDLAPEHQMVLAVGHKIQTFSVGPRPIENKTTPASSPHK